MMIGYPWIWVHKWRRIRIRTYSWILHHYNRDYQIGDWHSQSIRRWHLYVECEIEQRDSRNQRETVWSELDTRNDGQFDS